jgi:hypothetical protein
LWAAEAGAAKPHLPLLEPRSLRSLWRFGRLAENFLGSGLPRTFAAHLLALPRLPSPGAFETRAFIERHKRTFGGSGVGWADAQIVLAAAKSGARVHTSDGGVRKVCKAIGVVLA